MLETDFCGLKLKNPTILASGILGVAKGSLKKVADSGAGAVTIKSISREERKGHKNPILVGYEAGFLNAVGYPNPGIEEAKKEFVNLQEIGVPVIGSIIGGNAEEFAYMAKNFANTQGFDAIEIPLSCPHTPGFGVLAGQSTPQATMEITRAVKESINVPLIVKISPSAPELGGIAKAAQKAGADAINMGNTLGPGMVINIEARKPVLDFKVGGLSGPGIKPIAVRCVYDVYEATGGKMPIIGTGGVTYGRDAIEMIMAGASAVGIGTAVYYRTENVFKKICEEMKEWMKKNKVRDLKEIRGVAHE
jgi:dihydroorotate dehydrogenase (NAD+) catalytic subunit